MKEVGFKQSTSDPCVFVRSGQELEILAVYVDDLMLITESTESVDELKQPFKKRYKMKDMGSCPISWHLCCPRQSKELCLSSSEASH